MAYKTSQIFVGGMMFSSMIMADDISSILA
jgi:hypothetical protein